MGQQNSPEEQATGDNLLSMFVMAMTNLVTAETAKYVAAQTEQSALDNIQAAQRRAATHPDNTQSPTSYDSLARTSLQAHVRKTQAHELDSFTQSQLHVMEADIRRRYRRKKIRVVVTEPSKKPLDSISVNPKTGVPQKSTLTAKRITGIFDDVSLSKNALILTPTFASKLILPNRKYFIAYVVEPTTQQPMVELQVL